MFQNMRKEKWQEISGTHAAIKLQCVRHRTRIELGKGSIVAWIQDRALQGEERVMNRTVEGTEVVRRTVAILRSRLQFRYNSVSRLPVM